MGRLARRRFGRGWSRLSSGRLPQVQPGECCLCGDVAKCFSFLDNEGYAPELLCKDCLLEATKMLKEHEDGKEVEG